MKKSIFLVALFLFACICIGCFFRGAHVQKSDQGLYDLLVQVLQHGGAFDVASNDQSSDSKRVTPGDAILPEDIENIDNLGVRKFVVTQEKMALFANIKRLEYLMFSECEFSGDVFAPMENSIIRHLYIKSSDSVIPGISGRSISKLKNLDTLGLTNSSVSDEFYKNCSSLNIKYLGIDEVSVRAENLKDMLPLPNLSWLMLFDTDIGDDITGFLDELPALKSLSISFSHPSKMRCEFIRDMKDTDNIEEITIYNSDIDDEILSEITRFKNLTSLTVFGGKITKDSIPVIGSFANGKRSIFIRNGDEILSSFKPD